MALKGSAASTAMALCEALLTALLGLLLPLHPIVRTVH